jgi:hypothetical protein
MPLSVNGATPDVTVIVIEPLLSDPQEFTMTGLIVACALASFDPKEKNRTVKAIPI